MKQSPQIKYRGFYHIRHHLKQYFSIKVHMFVSLQFMEPWMLRAKQAPTAHCSKGLLCLVISFPAWLLKAEENFLEDSSKSRRPSNECFQSHVCQNNGKWVGVGTWWVGVLNLSHMSSFSPAKTKQIQVVFPPSQSSLLILEACVCWRGKLYVGVFGRKNQWVGKRLSTSYCTSKCHHIPCNTIRRERWQWDPIFPFQYLY